MTRAQKHKQKPLSIATTTEVHNSLDLAAGCSTAWDLTIEFDWNPSMTAWSPSGSISKTWPAPGSLATEGIRGRSLFVNNITYKEFQKLAEEGEECDE